jgi:hypothetical protein
MKVPSIRELVDNTQNLSLRLYSTCTPYYSRNELICSETRKQVVDPPNTEPSQRICYHFTVTPPLQLKYHLLLCKLSGSNLNSYIATRIIATRTVRHETELQLRRRHIHPLEP